MSVVLEQRGQLWVDGYRAFILEILDLYVQALDLSIKLIHWQVVQLRKWKQTYEYCGFLTQAYFLLLNDLRLIEAGHNVLHICVLLRIDLTSTIGFDELLDAVISCIDNAATLLDQAILGLDLFEQVRYFGGQICDCI